MLNFPLTQSCTEDNWEMGFVILFYQIKFQQAGIAHAFKDLDGSKKAVFLVLVINLLFRWKRSIEFIGKLKTTKKKGMENKKKFLVSAPFYCVQESPLMADLPSIYTLKLYRNILEFQVWSTYGNSCWINRWGRWWARNCAYDWTCCIPRK